MRKTIGYIGLGSLLFFGVLFKVSSSSGDEIPLPTGISLMLLLALVMSLSMSMRSKLAMTRGRRPFWPAAGSLFWAAESMIILNPLKNQIKIQAPSTDPTWLEITILACSVVWLGTDLLSLLMRDAPLEFPSMRKGAIRAKNGIRYYSSLIIPWFS